MIPSTRLAHSLGLLGLLAVFALAGCEGRRHTDDGGMDARTGAEMGGDSSGGCGAGQMSCGGTCIDTNGDARNCGMCGRVCPSGVGCAGGTCSCTAPMAACSGACVDTMADATNCGMCGHTCLSTEQCNAGRCVAGCDPPRMHCAASSSGDPDAGTPMDGGAVDSGVATVCTDVSTDPLHCGSCGTVCGGGTVCTAGHCECPTGQQPCDGVCMDTVSDPLHCGGCRVSCGPAGACSGGRCTSCGSGFVTCPGGTLGCIDTMTSAFDCGMCGHHCAPGETCTAGVCGCHAPAMNCGVGCTDVTVDPSNCGACGHDCGAGGSCTSMSCVCASGFSLCDGSCFDEMRDTHHCGDCTTVCPGMQVCVAGSCIDAPLYHGWTSPIGGCSTTTFDTMLPTVLGGTYPSNSGDSLACRAWKLAATVCTTMPTMYTDTNNWTCPTSGGFTDPVFGTYCTPTFGPQYACSTCPGACNAGCVYHPLSLRDCSGRETNEM